MTPPNPLDDPFCGISDPPELSETPGELEEEEDPEVPRLPEPPPGLPSPMEVAQQALQEARQALHLAQQASQAVQGVHELLLLDYEPLSSKPQDVLHTLNHLEQLHNSLSQPDSLPLSIEETCHWARFFLRITPSYLALALEVQLHAHQIPQPHPRLDARATQPARPPAQLYLDVCTLLLEQLPTEALLGSLRQVGGLVDAARRNLQQSHWLHTQGRSSLPSDPLSPGLDDTFDTQVLRLLPYLRQGRPLARPTPNHPFGTY